MMASPDLCSQCGSAGDGSGYCPKCGAGIVTTAVPVSPMEIGGQVPQANIPQAPVVGYAPQAGMVYAPQQPQPGVAYAPQQPQPGMAYAPQHPQPGVVYAPQPGIPGGTQQPMVVVSMPTAPAPVPVAVAAQPRPMSMGPAGWPAHGCNVTCTNCHKDVRTSVHHETSGATHCAAFLLLWVFFPCACLPYCTECTKDIVHTCPSCKVQLGRRGPTF